jgi:NAD(P)H-flavin reductase
MTEFIEKILDIKPETHDVKTFRLTRSKNLEFIPGQYCLVRIIKQDNEKRPFTFSSSPTKKEYFELTIKKIGEFTSKIFNLKKNDKLGVTRPYGKDLNFNENIKQDIVFLAGGSGITPFMSALRYSILKNLPNKFFLFFGNHSEKDIIYHDELNSIDNNHDNIKVINSLVNPNEEWKGETGFIDMEMITKYIKEPKNYLWYICGPPVMNNSMKKILKQFNLNKKNIRIEPWEIPGKER